MEREERRREKEANSKKQQVNCGECQQGQKETANDTAVREVKQIKYRKRSEFSSCVPVSLSLFLSPCLLLQLFSSSP